MRKTALVLGAGGFIGSHMVNRLKKEGYWVRGVDLKYPDFSRSQADEFLILDLRDVRNVEACMRLFADQTYSYFQKPFSGENISFDEVYQFAADMGGCQYVFTGEHDADILSNSALININVATWSQIYKVKKVFYSSSACMYPQHIQEERVNLKESDAYPANPDSDYGWEKIFSERLWLAYAKNYNLDVRIGRFHNIYGPEGTYVGGKEKAPASISRKVALAADKVEMWGDGQQSRSFLFIDDCIDAVKILMESDHKDPINIGSEESVTIKQLWELAIDISNKGVKLESIPMPNKVMGVRHRNSDNTIIESLGWTPSHSLRMGLEKTYNWIKGQVNG